MARLSGLLALVLLLGGCFAPHEQVVVRNWRPLGPGGLTLGQLLAVSPGVRAVVWESFAGPGGATVVRVSVEYDPARAAAGCPPPGAGQALAARCFFLLDCTVAPDGGVTVAAARAQAYSARGYFEALPLDLGVVADLVARASPLPCAAIALPDYL